MLRSPRYFRKEARDITGVGGDKLQILTTCTRKPTEGTAIEVDLAPASHWPVVGLIRVLQADLEPNLRSSGNQSRETEIATNLRQVGPSDPRRTLSLHWTARCEKRKACHFDVLEVKDKSESEFGQRGEGSGKSSSQRKTLKWT